MACLKRVLMIQGTEILENVNTQEKFNTFRILVHIARARMSYADVCVLSKFEIYVETLHQFLPWMFSLNHTHY